jgi:hypothetical protein
MSTNVIAGLFPVAGTLPDNTAYNFADLGAFGTPGTATWSSGGTLVMTVPQSPAYGEAWRIIGASFTFTPLFQAGTNPPPYGLIGDIWGGIVQGAVSIVNPAGPPFHPSTVVGFPADQSTVTKLWDGTTDSIQGYRTSPASVPTAYKTTAGGIQLPVPIVLSAGEQISAGLWLMPSLAANIFGVFVAKANWSIQYEAIDPGPVTAA